MGSFHKGNNLQVNRINPNSNNDDDDEFYLRYEPNSNNKNKETNQH